MGMQLQDTIYMPLSYRFNERLKVLFYIIYHKKVLLAALVLIYLLLSAKIIKERLKFYVGSISL